MAANGSDIFKIRHDVDFTAGAKPRLEPCRHLRADARIDGPSVCPNTPTLGDANITEMFGILSPIPHEIMARTGTKWASQQPGGTPLITVDINGNDATNVEYLFPLGMNLSGVTVPEFVEIDLNALNTPVSFSGIPWNLDRRLSPGGCDGACEATPQPLDPFPFEGIDPRTQAGVPLAQYSDPTFTASPLLTARNRILSFVDANVGNFNDLGTPPLTSNAATVTVLPPLATGYRVDQDGVDQDGMDSRQGRAQEACAIASRAPLLVAPLDRHPWRPYAAGVYGDIRRDFGSLRAPGASRRSLRPVHALGAPRWRSWLVLGLAPLIRPVSCDAGHPAGTVRCHRGALDSPFAPLAGPYGRASVGQRAGQRTGRSCHQTYPGGRASDCPHVDLQCCGSLALP